MIPKHFTFLVQREAVLACIRYLDNIIGKFITFMLFYEVKWKLTVLAHCFYSELIHAFHLVYVLYIKTCNNWNTLVLVKWDVFCTVLHTASKVCLMNPEFLTYWVLDYFAFQSICLNVTIFSHSLQFLLTEGSSSLFRAIHIQSLHTDAI
jgi:hypothetical protein